MKDAYYFSHDSNAKDDPKCVLLIEQLGLEGYGIYWVLIETLRDQPEYKYPINLISALARRYNTTAEKMKTVVNGYGLFEIDEQDFFSLSLLRRMEVIDEKREKARMAINARWSKQKQLPAPKENTEEIRTYNECITDEIQGKESIGKKSIEKDKYTDDFLAFYESYPNPQDKQRTFKNWKTCLKSRTVSELMKSAENYKEYTQGRERQYIKSSANFLGKDETYKDYLMENYKGGSNGTNKQPNGENKQTPKFDRTKFLAPGTF